MIWFAFNNSQALLQRLWLFSLKNEDFLKSHGFYLKFDFDFKVFKSDLLNLVVKDCDIQYIVYN